MQQFNWVEGKIAFKEIDPAASRWRVTSAADWMPRGEHISVMDETPEQLYGDLLPVLQNSDLRIVNVETVLGESGEPIAKAGPNLRADVRTMASLRAVPFDVACLANNHTLDFGLEGLANTIKVLEEAGIRTTGAGLNGEEAAEPFLTKVKGANVAIINCAEGEACRSIGGGPGAYGLDLLRLQEQIREFKARQTVVIVIFHGGREYAPVPPPYVVRDLRAIAEMGADAIIGHHPHVPQGIEVYRGVPIVYSQGNFAFLFSDTSFYRHAGYVVHLDFCGCELFGLAVTPYQITPKGVRLMDSGMLGKFNAEMERVSDLLGQPGAVEDVWDAFVDRYGREYIISSLEKAAEELRSGQDRRAAATANLFFTPAHSELYINALKRISAGRLGDSPEWAKSLVEHWLTLNVSEV